MILNGKSYLIRRDKKNISVEVYTDFFSIDPLFETERLLKMVTTDWEFPLDSIGIPPELVIKIYDHKNVVGYYHSCHGRSGFSALYVSVGGSQELTELVRIVSLFNQLPMVNMTVVCPVAYPLRNQVFSKGRHKSLPEWVDKWKEYCVQELSKRLNGSIPHWQRYFELSTLIRQQLGYEDKFQSLIDFVMNKTVNQEIKRNRKKG